MKFLAKISSLKNIYGAEKCGVKDNALLYGIYDSTPPLAKHIVFSPMPENVMQEMVRNYKRPFPKELMMLFQALNGADLFWVVHFVGKKRYELLAVVFRYLASH